MTTRNIVIQGMTGGAGHVGMVTQGFGGTFIPSVARVLTAKVKQVRRTATVIQKVRKAG